jgi:hypothetical protein
MFDETEIDIPKVLDAACRAVIEEAGHDWDNVPYLVKFNLKEALVVPVDAAVKEVLAQVNTQFKKAPIISCANDTNGNHEPRLQRW